MTSKPTRRMVLAATAAVATAGALGVGTTAFRWWDRAPGAGLQALSDDEHAFVQAVAEAWMPAGGEPELSGADAELGAFFDEVVAGMERATGRELKLLLQLLDDLTVPTRLAAFRNLPLADRIEVLHGWLHSDLAPLRAGTQAVLVLIGVGWTTHPQVVGAIQPLFRCGYGR